MIEAELASLSSSWAVAKASAAEVRSQLYVALDQKYVEDHDFHELSALAIETGRMVGGLMNYLRQSGHRGSRFKPVS